MYPGIPASFENSKPNTASKSSQTISPPLSMIMANSQTTSASSVVPLATAAPPPPQSRYGPPPSPLATHTVTPSSPPPALPTAPTTSTSKSCTRSAPTKTTIRPYPRPYHHEGEKIERSGPRRSPRNLSPQPGRRTNISTLSLIKMRMGNTFIFRASGQRHASRQHRVCPST